MPTGFQPVGSPPAGFQPVEPSSSGLAEASAAQALKIDRIRLRRDFLSANSGIRVPMPVFVLLVKPRESGAPRAGFTVSKKVGNAVARNRAKRRLREVARLTMPEFAVPGADHVFIARATDAERPFEQLLLDARHALQKARRKLEAGR